MRILLLSQWFEPEPCFKGLVFARELARRGHDVEVLTGFPNYPGGKLYPGYRLRFWLKEVIDGIPVLRVPLYPSHSKSVAGRVLNYVSFALSATIGFLFVHHPDVIYVYHPPASVALPALVARLLFHVPLVYDVQDLWPDSLSATGMVNNRKALRVLELWCQLIYRIADRITVLSPGFRQALVSRGVDERKIDVIYNWCDERAIEITGREVQPDEREDGFTVVFAGTLGPAQALDVVLEAAQICTVSIPRARFIFIGGGIDRDRLAHKAGEMRLRNVRFLQFVPMHEIGRVLAAADVLLVHLKDDPLFRITIPSKTQAYLASGRPILMAIKGDAADLIRASGGGLVCEPGNPYEIAQAVGHLSSLSKADLVEMGHAGRVFYDRELSLKAGVDRFELIFQSIA